METAVIFVNDRAWLKHEPKCVGVRFDCQIIPSGSWIIALLREGDKKPNALDLAYFDSCQLAGANTAIEYGWRIVNEGATFNEAPYLNLIL